MRGESGQFEIRWFRENTTGAVEDLELGDPIMLHDKDWFSRYHDIAFLNQPYSPSLLGKYWCQVIINTTADPDQPLMRSNVFTLLAPGDYSGPTCTGTVQTVFNITCADLSTQTDLGETTAMHSSPIFTTMTAPAHTPSVVTTPTQTSAAQQGPSVISVMGVVIVIISVLAVRVIVILFIKWRKITNSNKG